MASLKMHCLRKTSNTEIQVQNDKTKYQQVVTFLSMRNDFKVRTDVISQVPWHIREPPHFRNVVEGLRLPPKHPIDLKIKDYRVR